MTDQIRGNLFIVAAPSGGGKTSLVKELVSAIDNIEISVSHTTRCPRPGETEGRDYFFVSELQFTDMINNNEFVEYARVFNHFYGTSISQINARLDAGIDVVLDIDWQGAEQIRRLYSESVGIFIVPPSLAVLRQRLRNRAQDGEDVIRRRMQQACDEMSHYSEFDFLIVNDHFLKAALELQAIVLANRLSMARQSIKTAKLLSLLLTPQ